MTTRLLDDPAAAAALLRAGRLVAFPTETVYGLGAHALDPAAVARIFEAKGRPADNPLIVHVASVADLPALADVSGDAARRLADAFMPGPLTLVLPRRPCVPDVVTAGLDTVAVRVPGHPLAHALLRAAAVPVAAPSANRSGRPSPTSWEAVHADLNGRIDALLRGPRTDAGLESTVVDASGSVPVLLRAGAVSLEALRAVVPSVASLPARADLLRRSPGTRHRHYAPQARVVTVAPGAPLPDVATPAAWIGLSPAPVPVEAAFVAASVAAYAHEVFHFFRHCDAAGIATILCERVPEAGLGAALNDRLQRASEG